MSEMMSTSILLFLVIDPFGNLPIFISILKHFSPIRRRVIIIREMLVALLLMIAFLLIGEQVLSFLNLRTEVVSISGGIILFLIAIKMVFITQQDHNKFDFSTKEEEPFLVPLATPLVAGPSVLATLLLLSRQYPHQIKQLTLALLAAWGISFFILMLSNIFLHFLGKKGVIIFERLMGLLLLMIAIQMFLDGVHSYFRFWNSF
ncbi:YhgN family NAAT transporter [Sodalis sp. CWE]|uniref:YhgN family NAAT transporter n=1 Tax=Sodalis sp. CWE TaxID=2803816 RepID=UPI001C7CA6DB|nr:YhgN family NAAT transporter [Sodalis sp. CWE]MBX4181122.1 YhgN family NAAT transporter [Sodalis sp. CWE]